MWEAVASLWLYPRIIPRPSGHNTRMTVANRGDATRLIGRKTDARRTRSHAPPMGLIPTDAPADRPGREPIERGPQRHQVFGRVRADTLVPADRDRVEEPPHGAAEEPPAPGEPGERRVDRSAKRPHKRAGPATGTGLRRHVPAPFTPRAQTTAGFRAMVSSRTSEK